MLHVGLLVLIGGIAVQQAFHDGGAFELSEGEQATLSAPDTVFSREAGPLAPRTPPELKVALTSFDPYLHQEGYVPDRLSRLEIQTATGETVSAVLDRAAGVRVDGVQLYQAIPTGLSLNVELPGLGFRSIHLRGQGLRRAAGEVTDAAGREAHFVVETERTLNNVRGTGRLTIRLERGGEETRLEPGSTFDWGNGSARLVAVGRWAGFTYARSPAVGAVFAGFLLVLGGAALLAFPAGVVRLGTAEDNCAARVWLTRGTEALRKEWEDSARERES